MKVLEKFNFYIYVNGKKLSNRDEFNSMEAHLISLFYSLLRPSSLRRENVSVSERRTEEREREKESLMKSLDAIVRECPLTVDIRFHLSDQPWS